MPFTGGATTATPCADADTEDPTCFNDHGFIVPANGPGVDNAKARESPEGTPRTFQAITVARGGRRLLNLDEACASPVLGKTTVGANVPGPR